MSWTRVLQGGLSAMGRVWRSARAVSTGPFRVFVLLAETERMTFGLLFKERSTKKRTGGSG